MTRAAELTAHDLREINAAVSKIELQAARLPVCLVPEPAATRDHRIRCQLHSPASPDR